VIANRYLIVSLSKEQVQHVAQLARLHLQEDQFDDIVAKLSRIVDFVDQLQRAPTEDVVPMAHPLNQVQRLRPDVVTETDEREAIQVNAPAVSDGFYLVPKVIE
jgi:aspartyl-tRNA(Asn)/glutamyl-tRNA(Gln) amidotransferase subunit C